MIKPHWRFKCRYLPSIMLFPTHLHARRRPKPKTCATHKPLRQWASRRLAESISIRVTPTQPSCLPARRRRAKVVPRAAPHRPMAASPGQTTRTRTAPSINSNKSSRAGAVASARQSQTHASRRRAMANHPGRLSRANLSQTPAGRHRAMANPQGRQSRANLSQTHAGRRRAMANPLGRQNRANLSQTRASLILATAGRLNVLSHASQTRTRARAMKTC